MAARGISFEAFILCALLAPSAAGAMDRTYTTTPAFGAADLACLTAETAERHGVDPQVQAQLRQACIQGRQWVVLPAPEISPGLAPAPDRLDDLEKRVEKLEEE